jgi:hypothetical protein
MAKFEVDFKGGIVMIVMESGFTYRVVVDDEEETINISALDQALFHILPVSMREIEIECLTIFN